MNHRQFILIVIALCFSLLAGCTALNFIPGRGTPEPTATLLQELVMAGTSTAFYARHTPAAAEPLETTPDPLTRTAQAKSSTPSTHTTATPVLSCSPGTPRFNARYISNAVIMDGDVEAWFASFHEASHLVGGEDKWAGEGDLSAVFQMGWKEENLYLVVRVTDERYRQHVQYPAETYLGDSIEVLLDTDLCGDLEDTKMNSDDFQFRISPGYDSIHGERFVYRVAPDPSILDTQVQVVTGRTEEGVTNYEIQIPWHVLGIENPVAGMMFRFALFINDNDDPQDNVQETVLSTAYKPLGDSLGPHAWALMVLR